MIVVRALYELKSSGAAFRALLAEVLDGLEYVPQKPIMMYTYVQQ